MKISEFKNGPSFRIGPSFLFNDPHLNGKGKQGKILVYLDSETMDWSMCLLLQINSGKAVSPVKMPFGGIDFKDSLPSRGNIVTFYEKLIDLLTSKGVSSFKICLPPEVYNKELVSSQYEVLIGMGFINSSEGINFHLNLSDPFVDHLHHSLTRKYKKALTENWDWEINGAKDLPEFFEFSRACRSKKSLPINISQDLLTGQFNSHPERYDLFIVRDKDRIIAAGIGVKVSDEVYYKFLPSTDPDYNHLSPMVFLTSIMHQRAIERNCKVLDLGIAGPLGGPVNHGLEVFKYRLGGKPSHKCCFFKEF